MDYNKLKKSELVKLLEKTDDKMAITLHYKLKDQDINKLLKLRSICRELKYANIGFNMFNSDIKRGTLNFNIVEYSIGGSKYSDLPSELIVTTKREEIDNIYYDFRDIYHFVDDKIKYINTQRHVCNLQMDEKIYEQSKLKPE